MYSVIDIESNGAAFRKESIIEIAVYKYDGHKIVDQFSSMVNPEAEITPFVQKLTGITPKMVKTAPKFHEIAKRIIEISEGTTLVGHNVEFDYRMLKQSFKKLGYNYVINTLDTIPLAKKLFPEEKSYSLGKLVKSLGIPLTNAHRASGDARATLDLFRMLLIKDKSGEIIEAQHTEQQTNNFLNKVKVLTEDLPSEKGIVYFQNNEGKILFSDFCDDLYKNTKKILTSNSKKWKEIQEDTEHVSYELTGNDLIGKLMLQTKRIRRKTSLPFGLFYFKNNYFIEKISRKQNQLPLLKFKSYTQALKALNYIKSQEKFTDFEEFKKQTSLDGRNQLFTFSGRVLGEKAFLVLKNGKPFSYGFYELYTQISDKKKLEKLQIPITETSKGLLNDIQLGLLKNDFEIISLN